jgi:hypothetical protein
MTNELLKRMAQWLVYFEPKRLHFYQGSEQFALERIGFFSLELLRSLGNEDQNRVVASEQRSVNNAALFDFCCQTADARGLNFIMHRITRLGAFPNEVKIVSILHIDMRALDPNENRIWLDITEHGEHYGFHMADALLQALGARDWRTREPEAVQP